jgi:flagellar hook protein FlgE
MRSDQTYMDVVGNNIANVNSAGYKASRVTFQDMISQTVGVGGAPTAQSGGVDPSQVGLGVQVGGTSTVTAAGGLEQTQSPTDLAIQGDGFFILSDGQGGQQYTRDGSFSLGATGDLTSVNGLNVMGWVADPKTGQVNPSGPLQPLVVPVGSQLAAQTSTEVTLSGNLDQRLDATASPPANRVQENVTVYDSLGDAHQITLTFTKTNNTTNAWSWQASTTDTGVTVSGSGTLGFNATTGAFIPPSGGGPEGSISLTLGNGATSSQPVNLSFDGVTQLAATGQLNGTTDGQPPGSFSGVSVDAQGNVTAAYSNGQKRLVGQVALASFSNPAGLLRQGDSNFAVSPNSGAPVLGTAGTSGRGQIDSGYLEQSNVDLTQEFSNMIMAQRGFEASTRVFSTTNQMLSDLVTNLFQG